MCGSDLWDWRGINPVPEPKPMGHEYAGVVEQVGSEVRNVKPALGGRCKIDASTVVGNAPQMPRPKVSLELLSRQSLAIVSESGSGKPTIARMIEGRESATYGTITVCGNDRSRPSARVLAPRSLR